MNRPALTTLEQALRQPMPKGFFWNFEYFLREAVPYCPQIDSEGVVHTCGTVGCAIGLAHSLGILSPTQLPEDGFDLPLETVERIFYGAFDYRVSYYQVTPTMVANKIKELLDAEP